MAVDIATGLLFTWPSGQANQRTTICILTVLTTLYGQPITIVSDQGTHFTGQNVKRGATQLQIQ